MLTKAPQATLSTVAGFADMEMLTTWNGPGRRQMPDGTTFAETGAPPPLDAVIEPLTVEVEVNWIATLLNVYVTV